MKGPMNQHKKMAMGKNPPMSKNPGIQQLNKGGMACEMKKGGKVKKK